MDPVLLKKYDVPAPRYTSYPTVPYWSENPSESQWLEQLKFAMQANEASWSIYIHIPFCESLCTYCGCNTSITKNHEVEEPYIDVVLKEWQKYLEAVPEFSDKPLRELHLGGGTPTFLSPENLEKLLKPILGATKRADNFQASLEVDPRVTTEEHLETLYKLGFTRISMGVQDYNPEVQHLINRIQPFDITKALTDKAREMGFTSVNHDLIYGLPAQSLENMQTTIDNTLKLMPERIALYSYAHVPWIKKSQRLFTEDDLPKSDEKRALYDCARKRLLENGYIEIGMDHFALPQDTLSIANDTGDLHRNFMGYTQARTDVLLGLGVSSISETPGCFHQNEKVMKKYKDAVNQDQVPTFRGHLLSEQDQQHREQILQLMTAFNLSIDDQAQLADTKTFLAELIEDGLISFEGNTLHIPEVGKPFLRNVCMAFDQRMREKAPNSKIFSQAM